MSEPIKPGDLVVVVGVHCSDQWLGKTFQVSRVGRAGDAVCHDCRKKLGAVSYASHPNGGYYNLQWLKKIEPLTDPETERHDEEITA